MAYELEEARKLVLKACKELVEHKLIARTWGNISARIGKDKFVITPSGRDYDSLTLEDIVVVDLNGKYVGDIKPSSELGVHAQCYKLRPEVNFVIHTHQPYASALSILGYDIKLGKRVSQGTKDLLGNSIITAEYGRNASKKLANNVALALDSNPDCYHVLMKYHGALCLGEDYQNAFKVAYTLEALSQKVYEYYIGEPICTEGEGISVIQSVPDELIGPDGSSTERLGTWILHARTPYILKYSEKDENLKPYLDDVAQIAGVSIRCISADATASQIEKCRGDNAAIFVENEGAYCYGESYLEAEAVCLVLEKACLAAYLADKKNAEPLKMADALHDRINYVKKYSKLRK